VATRFPLAHPPFPSFTLLWPATVFVSLILSHVTVNQTFSAGHGLDGEHTVVDLGEVRRVTVPRHLCALSPALACTLLTMVVIIIIFTHRWSVWPMLTTLVSLALLTRSLMP